MNYGNKIEIERTVNGYILRNLGTFEGVQVFEDRPSENIEDFENDEFNFMSVIFEVVEQRFPNLKVKFFK